MRLLLQHGECHMRGRKLQREHRHDTGQPRMRFVPAARQENGPPGGGEARKWGQAVPHQNHVQPLQVR